MTTDNLKQTLAELHAALERSGPLDPELVQLLKTLDDDIQIKLVRHAAAAPTPETTQDDDGLSARAQALSARFAAQHPQLEPVLRAFTETLQRIGI